MQGEMMKIYVASKVKHANVWKNLRNRGINIISTWIDEAGEGESTSYSELATRCIDEVSRADILFLYCEPREVLKGALIEVGAALALGKSVICIGNCESISRIFSEHPKWKIENSIDDAIKKYVIRKEG